MCTNIQKKAMAKGNYMTEAASSVANEPWYESLFHEIVILIFFPIYTMLHSYLTFIFILYYFTRARVPLIAYLTYILFFDPYPSKGFSRTWWDWDRIEWCRNWTCWQLASNYFPRSKLVKTCELPPEYNYLFLFHPHGIISLTLQVRFLISCL